MLHALSSGLFIFLPRSCIGTSSLESSFLLSYKWHHRTSRIASSHWLCLSHGGLPSGLLSASGFDCRVLLAGKRRKFARLFSCSRACLPETNFRHAGEYPCGLGRLFCFASCGPPSPLAPSAFPDLGLFRRTFSYDRAIRCASLTGPLPLCGLKFAWSFSRNACSCASDCRLPRRPPLPFASR